MGLSAAICWFDVRSLYHMLFCLHTRQIFIMQPRLARGSIHRDVGLKPAVEHRTNYNYSSTRRNSSRIFPL